MSRVVAGIQPVREAIRALGNRVEKLLVLHRPDHRSPTLDALSRFARDQGIPVEPAPDSTLDRLAPRAMHQGAVALVPDLRLIPLDVLVRSDASLVIALDRIVDPHNFGAVVRSSVAFGAQAVMWPENSSAPLSQAMFRASAGAVEHASLCRVRSLPEALLELRQAGRRVVGLAGDGPDLLPDIDLTSPVVVVVGSEGEGLRKGVRNACDSIARIPTLPPVSVLNASVSAAVALYEVRRQRLAAQPPSP